MKTEQHPLSYYIINGITIYRIIAAPFLIYLIITGKYDIFKWLLAVSFFTDLIDGYLARKFKVTSILGTKLDSIGDDLTVLTGMIGLFVINPEFILQHKYFFLIPFILLVIQISYALIRYKKLTSFHTYLAKLAALLQGVFLILLFLLNKPILFLFYAAVLITILDIIEEIILVYLLPNWETNVHSLFYILTMKKNNIMDKD
jgi:CDP-diacylglycerol--glycerol-3-phosphate 3-phosphatidyltransferase